jgi:hypothetical protein
MSNDSEFVPAVWSLVSTHVVPGVAVVPIFQDVDLQLADPPPIAPVTDTVAIIVAPGDTVSTPGGTVAPFAINVVPTTLIVSESLNAVCAVKPEV